jgi:putative DNA primase/helicase
MPELSGLITTLEDQVGDPENVFDLAKLKAEGVADQKRRRAAMMAKMAGYGKEKPKEEKPKEKPRIEVDEIVFEQKEKVKNEKPKAEAPKEDFGSTFTRPKIELCPKTSPKFMPTVERALLHLNNAKAGIYQRGGKLVQLIEEYGTGVKGEPIKVWKLVEVNERTLDIQMMKHIEWIKRVKEEDSGKFVEQRTNPIGSNVAKYALEMRGSWPFPTVEGIISAPTLRPDGTLLDRIGHDPKTGLMLINSPQVKINPRPTERDAVIAIDLLRDLFVETAFKNEGARGVALSLVVSTICCGAIPNTPIHMIRAPVGASGKTYLVQIVHVIATGEKCVPMGRTRSNEEFEKRLSALMIEGRPLVFLDNHNGVLSHDLLCQATTGDKVLIRRFGKLENIEVGTRAVIAATGNGISIEEDLNRRTLLIEIDTKLAQPQFKIYRKPSPLDMILANRAKYIEAALTIPLAYMAAGCPVVTNKEVLDFEDWSRIVRCALIWLGEADPLMTMEDAIDTDADRRNARAMRVAIKTVCGTGEKNARFAEAIINELTNPWKNAHDLKARLDAPLEPAGAAWNEVLMAVAGVGKEPSAKRLGRWFGSKQDVIDGGLVIRGKRDGHTDMNVWWVDVVEG